MKNKKEQLKISEKQFELDQAAYIFTYGYSDRRNSMIRLTVILTTSIDSILLQNAADNTVKKYPEFFVSLLETKNEIKLITTKKRIKILKNNSNILTMTWDDMKENATRILFTQDSIILEFFHGISDANGGLFIIKELITEYLTLSNTISSCNKNNHEINFSNSYIDLKTNENKSNLKVPNVHSTFLIKSETELLDTPVVTNYYFRTSILITFAKKYNVSITQLLAAMLFEALNRLKMNNEKQKLIKLSIPVNLRTYFKSNTLRNFVWNLNLAIKNAHDDDLEAIANQIKSKMNEQLKYKNLLNSILPTVRLSKLTLIKKMPLPIKKFFIKYSLELFDKKSTMTMSNLGRVVFPEDIEKNITNVTMSFSPKPNSPYSCSIASFNDILSLSFSRTIDDDKLEKTFECVLNEINISFDKYILDFGGFN